MSRSALPLTLLVALSTAAGAQRAQLELRPHVGDTLRMRLDQVTEVSGDRKGAVMKPVTTRLTMFSRAIVEAETVTGAVIHALTDSVDVTSTDAHARALAEATEVQLRGRQMRLRLSPDGTVAVADGAMDVPRAVTDLVSVMPASFPKEPVDIGGTWTREMPIAAGTRLVPSGGVVRATFRLDSLSSTGDLAYVSMRGALVQTVRAAAAALSGSVDGRLVVDRRRGWLSQSRFLVRMRSRLVPPGAADADAMQFLVTITQHMRVFDRR